VTVDALSFDDGGVTATGAADAARAAPGTTWVRLVDPTAEERDAVMAAFDLHPLSIEDVEGEGRPKVEEFPSHTFILVKAATLRGGDVAFEEELRVQPVGLFVGPDWLVTYERAALSPIERVWERVESGDGRLLARGPDFTACQVVDRIVDEYFGLLDEVQTIIERVEDDVLSDPGIWVLEDLNAVRRDLLSIRRLLWPTREAVTVLARGDPPEVQGETEKYFRNVYDHLVQLVELTETYRDLASGARDIYLNALSVSTNEVMKKLTVVATIVLPLTFVVGVYGMNFGETRWNMPELLWPYGYPAVMLGMGLVAFVLVVYFRREGWL
jgi:magnesium transporter